MLLLLPSAFTTLLVLFARPAEALHSVCWWKGPGGDNPEAAGYEFYCDGSITDESISTARYTCEFHGGIVRQVADYGVLGPRQLEFGTPCNYGGHFLGIKKSCCCRRGHVCNGPACCCDHVALCLGDRDGKGNYMGGCFHMGVWDDCSWPVLFDPAKKPAQVHIWRHKVSHAEAVEGLEDESMERQVEDESMERQLDMMSGALNAAEA